MKIQAFAGRHVFKLFVSLCNLTHRNIVINFHLLIIFPSVDCQSPEGKSKKADYLNSRTSGGVWATHPAFLAAENGHREVLKFLLESDKEGGGLSAAAPADPVTGDTLLMAVCAAATSNNVNVNADFEDRLVVLLNQALFLCTPFFVQK